MRDPERIDRILSLIKEIWLKDEDSRFIQLVENIKCNYSKDNDNKGKVTYKKDESGVLWQYSYVDLFNLEDHELERYLERNLKEKNIFLNK